jgi:hypothetical protein
LKQLAKVVCEQRQFNLVFVNVVKYGYVFANNGNCSVLHCFIDELRVFDENEIIIQNVHDGITLVVEGIQVRNALSHRRARAQTSRRVRLKHAKTNVGAQLVGQFQRYLQAYYFEFLHVVDENAHGPVAHPQHKSLGVLANVNSLPNLDFVQYFLQTLRVNRVDFNNDLARLQIVNYFLNVGARCDEAHVVFVLVNAVAKHLLALLVDGVYVVQNYQFLFAGDERAGLAEYFHVVAIVLDALILQTV